MFARVLPLLVTGVALLIAGCSGGSDTSAAASGTGLFPAAPSDASSPTEPSEAKPSTEPVGDDAVGRYETYLHAIGNKDVTTACEIGRIADEKKGRGSLGPCEHSMEFQFEMYSPEEKKAMQGATVDRSRITESPTRVEIPAAVVKVDVELIETELDDAVMELRDGKWYRVK
ncbi:hypothetical protein [Amycolatopsis sp. RTGN1]|uniref:hypothetical protein n=1 Tax=Amycolatopsis ponsaeliensis TaxID=2992142 RepID=UPI00254DEB07|nr:hypothetical protein [Amycolatopsis sp. RTGN1]